MCCGREMGLPSVQEGGSGTEETPSDCTYGFSKRSAQKNERQRDLRKAPVSRGKPGPSREALLRTSETK